MRTRLASALLFALAGCTRSGFDGVLTLAPAGMEFTDGCTSKRDGTLDMPAGARAQQVAYFAAAPATITVTAGLLAAGTEATVDLWFEGTLTGSTAVTSTQNPARAFRVNPARAGPHALRVEVRSRQGDSASGPLLHLENVVITQP
jgi:hypothetical protein